MTKWQTKEQTKAWRTFLQHFSAGMGGKGRIYYIGGTDVLPQPLTPKEEEHLISCMGTVGEKEAKSRLIEHNLRLVVYIAKKFENTGVGVEDLISIGTIGLIKGINTFNKTKKIKLATYASRCIENEILMYLRRNSKRKTEVSIDEPLNVDWDGNELLLSDILGTDEDMVYRDMEEEAERRQLSNALSKLPSRERRIVELRYGINTDDDREMTQKEVADLMGISQSYISRLEKKIMNRLKKYKSTTITPKGFRNLPGNIKFLKTLQILKERILVNSIKQEYTIQQANYYLERKAATAA